MRRHIKVLLAEDDASIRNALQTFFLIQQYTVFIAQNGKEAMEIALREKPTIVITDFQMPEMDGIELCRQLRQNEETKSIPIIMMSGLAGKLLKDGVHIDYSLSAIIQKPFIPKHLLREVQDILEGKVPPVAL